MSSSMEFQFILDQVIREDVEEIIFNSLVFRRQDRVKITTIYGNEFVGNIIYLGKWVIEIKIAHNHTGIFRYEVITNLEYV